MKRNIRKAYGLAGVFALGASASAQQPAAELLPVRAVESTASIVRGATPYAPFAAIPQAPADSAPAPKFSGSGQSAPQGKSWISTQWNSAVNTVVGTPDGRPYVPFPSMDSKAPAKQVAPNAPIPGKVNPQRMPIANSGLQPVAATAPAQPAQGVYAGPPAYRWYGWGSTTPGANPHSPTGVYPKASANWYSQTGATPGAFPIPVTYPRPENGAEPPVYVGGLNPGMAEPTVRTVIAELPKSAPMPRYEPPMQTAAPAIPYGAPTPIAVNAAPPAPPPSSIVTQSAPVEAPPSSPIPAPTHAPVPASAPVVNELSWQAATKPIAEPTPAPVPVPAPPAPIIVPPPPMIVAPPAPSPVPPPMPAPNFTAPAVPVPAKEFVQPTGPVPLAPAAPIIAPVVEQEQAWARPKTPSNSGIVQASANLTVRAQQPHDAGATLDMSIRNACPTQVRKVEINRIGGNGLVVRFVVDSEAHAQDAATAVAELPELKAFDVRYEALLLAK